jgi:hypothetical protein
LLTVLHEQAKEKGDMESVRTCAEPQTRRNTGGVRRFSVPALRRAFEPLNQLERDYKAQMRFVFRHFPLASHANVTLLLGHAHL